MTESFDETVDEICRQDHRYHADAYHFIREALDYTSRTLQRHEQALPRHLTGQELVEGIRVYALQEFGPMALTVFRSWGIHRTEDFGEIVFNLVDSGKLGKQETDSRADFAGGYDFFEAFGRPFEPRHSGKTGSLRRGRTRRTPKRG